MLAAMTTVSSGLMSPNSYGLSPDQVAAKMAADHVESEYDHFRRDSAAFVRLHEHHQQRSRTSTNSSDDSESEAYPASPKTTEANSVTQLPKRNKRKNFKPRCSSSSNLPANEEEAATSDYVNVNNNNSLKNVRRRKTLATPRKVLVDRSSPMDLSRGGEESGSEVGGGGGGGGGGMESDSDSEDGVGRENGDGGKIPSSFSIHNLSQPYVPDFGGAALTQGQMSEMREYAMNTMRELLGIYGLTSEVAESISKQLPIAAFNTGKILENLSLASSHNNNPFQHRTPPSPPSQPPTPPSTPLSPKSDFAAKYAAAAATSSPFVTITRSSSPHHPHHTLLQQQKQPSTGGGNPSAAASSSPVPLNLKQHQKSSPRVAFSNGDFGLFGHHQQEKEERSPGCSGGGQSTRGIFPVQFPGMKMEESNSPPVVDSNPLNAMMAQSLAPTPSRDPSGAAAANLLLNKTQNQLDYSKYVKKFASSLECGSNYCKDLNYREHFHCLDCNSRVFIKKEEMIRHFKWHKKRDESLQHGFMRYSPLDDCGDRYANCTHNKKQTHYHCIKEGCDKVYISTSDVQMHANYHRKDSAIIQEGFQRYRATEECGASYCAFFGQRTTHFHCRRANCRFTFKNKSDMEKHKSYHIKDEQLSRDGFKKFMKNESCPYENCRFSKVCNHIHCIRPQCNYVLHSSGQLFSHKRKHERKDSELAYRKYKLAQSMMKTLQESGAVGYDAQQHFEGMASLAAASSNVSESLSERNSPVDYEDADGGGSSSAAMDLTGGGVQEETISWNGEEFWRKYCRFVGREESCEGRCEYGFVDHYHCLVERCEMVFNCRDAVREHARNHEQQEQVTDGFYSTSCCDDGCMYQDREKHWHCNWENCREVILLTDKPFRRLEHYKMHEYSRKLSLTKDPLTMTHLATSIDGMFCRKRGRPPKNRVIEVWNDYAPLGGQSLMDSPQAIFTSFKLPKPSTAQSSSKDMEQQDSNDERSHSPTPNDTLHGFDFYPDSTKCPDSLCPYLGTVHYHCSRDRCLYVTDKDDSLLAHSRDFHDNIDIPDGFEFCDRTVDCRLPGCPSNRVNRHFHCTRCGYSFVQYSTMAVHNQKHVAGEEALVKTEDGEESAGGGGGLCGAVNLSQQESKVSVVKASGTFYPLSSLPERNISPDLSKSTETSEQTSTNTLYGPELSCSRPFCKLKRKYHYHCNACNQAFSELDRLLTHAAKHTNLNNNNNTSNIDDDQQQQQQTTETVPKINVAPLQSLQNPTKIDQMEATAAAAAAAAYLPPNFDAYSHFSNFQLALMSQQNAFLPQSLYQNAGLMFQHPGLMQAAPSPFTTENLTSPLAAMAANLNKRSLSPHNTHEMSPEQKKVRIQNSMRMLKDEPVPEGYLRFRFNEDCQYQHCGYREHQTHFHCQRQDCGYSFCDKTRFVQHTARHERLDTLMGGDFQQYRANVACGRPDCAYTTNLGATQNKASHFHCLKCEFVCTDTNKVVAHRRQHQKLDSIQAAGFEKFTPSQHCRAPSCQHSGKQTHYHCLSCQYAVLGLAQMSAHKYRHMEG